MRVWPIRSLKGGRLISGCDAKKKTSFPSLWILPFFTMDGCKSYNNFVALLGAFSSRRDEYRWTVVAEFFRSQSTGPLPAADYARTFAVADGQTALPALLGPTDTIDLSRQTVVSAAAPVSVATPAASGRGRRNAERSPPVPAIHP